MNQLIKKRPRLMRSAKRCSVNDNVENVSLLLIGGLLVAIGMMLRY